MVEALPALASRPDEDPQIVEDLLLPDIFIEPLRPQRRLHAEVFRIRRSGEDALVGHHRAHSR